MRVSDFALLRKRGVTFRFSTLMLFQVCGRVISALPQSLTNASNVYSCRASLFVLCWLCLPTEFVYLSAPAFGGDWAGLALVDSIAFTATEMHLLRERDARCTR